MLEILLSTDHDVDILLWRSFYMSSGYGISSLDAYLHTNPVKYAYGFQVGIDLMADLSKAHRITLRLFSVHGRDELFQMEIQMLDAEWMIQHNPRLAPQQWEY